MGLVSSPEHNILLALDARGTYALGCIVESYIVTAAHVASGGPTFVTPDGSEQAQVPLTHSSDRDVAISAVHALIPGFSLGITPRVGDPLMIRGYHGQERRPFQTTVRVHALEPDGRIIVTRTGGTLPAVGMSGAPALTTSHEVVGILVASDDSTPDGYVLESLHDLFTSRRE